MVIAITLCKLELSYFFKINAKLVFFINNYVSGILKDFEDLDTDSSNGLSEDEFSNYFQANNEYNYSKCIQILGCKS